ncbi:MAG: methyltransferase domain-containing protein [Sphingobacteriales bacterium]|nr:MAG: methyltransferase domain-containing protein [Sphingobacteriales bacterium]
MYKVSKLQRALSYLVPIKIWKGSGTHNPVLELFISGGQWQLATEDAIYSDGNRYRPLRIAFHELRQHLSDSSSILVLGGGLGSALKVLERMQLNPYVTLVDIDETITAMARKLYSAHHPRARFETRDAAVFLTAVNDMYDLVVIDIFNSRVVPPFACTPEFLTACRSRVEPGGHLVMNYIVEGQKEWETFREVFRGIFPIYRIEESGANRILIATV